jgi:hypothetical protein
MNVFLRLLSRKSARMDCLIYVGLGMTIFRTIVDLVVSPWSMGIVTVGSIGMICLCFAQLIAFNRSLASTWVLSAIHVVTYVFLSIGTFSFIFSFILKPISGFYPMQASYLITGCVFLGEIAKTFYFYQTCAISKSKVDPKV